MYEFMYEYPAYFYIIAFLFVAVLIYNLRRFWTVKAGQPVKYATPTIMQMILSGLTFGVGQKKVLSKRFTYAAVMHFLLGWGFIELFIATTIDFATARGILVDFLPNLDTPWFAWVNDLGGMMLFAGLVMALVRRHIMKPEVLPQDAFRGRLNLLGDTGILLLLLILVVGGFLAEAARLAAHQPETASASWVGYWISKWASPATWKALEIPLWWFHAITSLLFIAILPLTKMFHALAGIVNAALTNHSARGTINAMHVGELMEDPEADIENISLGVSSVKEFTWKQLLDSISCTECARCTSVCPASISGKPLSPMKTIIDIRHNLYAEKLGLGEKRDLIGETVSETELWSCTTCGHCMEVCPVLVDHVPTFTEMRRYLVLSEGKPPEQASDSLEKTMQSGNPWGFPKKDRLKWASDAGLNPPVFKDKKKADVLYWVGCAGAYDPLNQQVAQSMIKILESAGIDYAVLGTEETCTGDSARRMGEEYLFETMAIQNIDTLGKYEFNTIVTPCPHCFHTLKHEYPAFGGDYEVIHHSEYISRLMKEGKLNPAAHLTGSVTYHDACYLGRHNNIFEPPREIISTIMKDGTLLEMNRNHEHSFCCGAGGGNMWHDIEEGDRINVLRFEEAAETGAETVATACSFCMIMMDDAMRFKGQEENMKVKDIAELVAEGLT